MKKILSLVAMLVMSLTAMAQAGTISNNGVTITEANGWLESAYIKFNLYSGAKTYNVYVKGGQYSDYTKIDEQLVRNYGSYGRADVVGLKAGTYAMKVVPVVDNKEVSGKYAEATGMTVANYSRQGFAFKGGYSPGAYNSDGTLKAGTKVFYVTKNTAKTIKTNVTGAKVNPCVGIQHIISGYEKGEDQTPIVFRIIGTISKEDLDSLGSSEEGIQIKGRKADSELNFTIEGIGDDATVKGFGFLVRNSKSVEFRNFAIMRCMDDGISLDTDNSNIWIHHTDQFYGKHGSGDHEKGDGAIDVKADSKLVTVSYNHFWDTGKSNMFGMKSESGPNYLSYDHNWFDHSDSRHPRVRTMSVHVWNNYFDNVAKYGVGAATGASIFVENNYFLKTKKPILSSKQGTDALGSGTFSGEDGGMIKAYGNYFDKTATNFKYYTQNNPASTGYDAYEVTSRNQQVPSSEKTVAGGTTYNNFDTNNSVMYNYTPDAASDVPTVVKGYYGAGRLNHGDFTYSFKDNVGSDETDSEYDTTLGNLLDNYKSSLVGIFGDENAESGEQGGEGGESGGEGGEGGESGGEGGESGGGTPVPVETGAVTLQSDNVPAGYQIDGSSSVTAYSYSSDLCKEAKLIKVTSDQHTITLPANAKVTKIVMYAVGDNNSDNKGAITELAGKTFNVSLPSRKNGTAFATATVDNVALTGTITFTVTYAAGVKFQLTVEENTTTGITEISAAKVADGIMYDLMGRRITAPRAGQIYIMNGKKFIKK